MAFKVISMEPRTLSWWRDEREDIDLDPPYQRKGRIWSKQQQHYLLDSILNGFDVPKIYVADFTFLSSKLNSKKKKYAVIDGKQRFTAVFDFFDGELRLPDRFSYEEDSTLNLSGLSFKDLVLKHPKIARRFENYSFSVMSVLTDSEAKINELFVRLNSSRPLNGAEIRNAMAGELPGAIRSLVEHTFFKIKASFTTARAQDKNLAAKLLLLEHSGTIVDTKKRQLDQLAEKFNQNQLDNTLYAEPTEGEMTEVLGEIADEAESSDISRTASRVRLILDRMSDIFLESDELLRNPAQIVVYYWLVRSASVEHLMHVRRFLIEFEKRREDNRNDLSIRSDSEISAYELYSRNGNDSFSIKSRFAILRDGLSDYVKSDLAG